MKATYIGEYREYHKGDIPVIQNYLLPGDSFDCSVFWVKLDGGQVHPAIRLYIPQPKEPAMVDGHVSAYGDYNTLDIDYPDIDSLKEQWELEGDEE